MKKRGLELMTTKTKAQLVAENKALHGRVAELETRLAGNLCLVAPTRRLEIDCAHYAGLGQCPLSTLRPGSTTGSYLAD